MTGFIDANCLNKKSNNFELNFQDEHGTYGIGYCTNTGNKFYFDMDDYDKIHHYACHRYLPANPIPFAHIPVSFRFFFLPAFFLFPSDLLFFFS